MTYKVVASFIDYDGSDLGNATKEFYSKQKAKRYADELWEDGYIIEGIYKVDDWGYETEISL
jgi:hypothetical protein